MNILDYAAAAYMENEGISSLLLPVVIVVELLGGLSLVFGYLTRIGASGLAFFCIFTAVLVHNDFSNPVELAALQKNLAIAGGMLVLMVMGPGDWAFDDTGVRRIFS